MLHVGFAIVILLRANLQPCADVRAGLHGPERNDWPSSARYFVGRVKQFLVEDNLNRFHMWSLLHSLLHSQISAASRRKIRLLTMPRESTYEGRAEETQRKPLRNNRRRASAAGPLAKERVDAILKGLDEAYPDAVCALDHRIAVGAAGGDDSLGAVHRRAREHGDAGAVPALPYSGGDGQGDACPSLKS